MSNDQYWISDNLGNDDGMDFLTFPDSNASASANANPNQIQQNNQDMLSSNRSNDPMISTGSPQLANLSQPQQNQQQQQYDQFQNRQASANSSSSQAAPNPSMIMEQMRAQRQAQQPPPSGTSQQQPTSQQQVLLERQRQYQEQLMRQQQLLRQQQQNQQQNQQNQQSQQSNPQNMFHQLQQQQQQLQQRQHGKPDSASTHSHSQGATPDATHSPMVSAANFVPAFQHNSQTGTPQSQPGNPVGSQNNQARQAQMQQIRQHFAPENVEKFLRLLEGFMTRNNTPLPDRYPTIGGRKMNLYFIYVMFSTLGGFENVIRTGRAPMVAQKSGIPTDDKQLMREFVQMYHRYLFPFEQYSKTPEGRRELSTRQQQQSSSPVPLPNQQSPHPQSQSQSQVGTPRNPSQTPRTPASSIQNLSTNSASNNHVPQPQQNVSTPTALSTSLLPTPGLPVPAPSAATPGSVSSFTPQAPPPRVLHRKTTAVSPRSVPAAPVASKGPLGSVPDISEQTETNSKPFTPDFIRNYVPHQKLVDKVNGFDSKTLNRYGEQLDHLKPVFLYFPELGRIDINALSLALASEMDAEINVALNILLIVTSDPSVSIPLSDCMDLLDNLCDLAGDILDSLRNDDVSKRNRDFSGENVRPAEKFESTRIDDIFDKLKDELATQYKQDKVEVIDSFTAKSIQDQLEDDENIEIDDTELIYDDSLRNEDEMLLDTPNLISDELTFFDIPFYLDMLHECKSEAEDFDSNLNLKTCQDRRLMLVEELSTISMILRNLSFVNDNENVFNNGILASHVGFRDYVFELIYCIAANPEAFVFSRKKLCLLKDTLITLTNVAHAIELRSSKEALLILTLCLSFGSKLADSEVESGLTVPKFDSVSNKYQLHGVDIISKILCGSSLNKTLVGNLLTGDEEDPEVIQLIKLYTKSDDLKDGKFTLRVFNFLISVIPIDLLHQGIEPFDERLPSCLEALLACLIITDFITPAAFTKNIALTILDAPESIGHSLVHLSFVYAAIYVNANFETKIQHAYVSIKCSELINSLIKACIDYATQNEINLEDLNALNKVSKLFSNDNNVIGALMTPDLPQEISVQAVESSNLMMKLKQLVK